MGGVPAAKAGVGSAGNDATRLLGGTLGVAVIGSTSSTPVSQRIATLFGDLPASSMHAAQSSVARCRMAAGSRQFLMGGQRRESVVCSMAQVAREGRSGSSKATGAGDLDVAAFVARTAMTRARPRPHRNEGQFLLPY